MYSYFFLKFQEKLTISTFIVRSLFYIAFFLCFWYDTNNLPLEAMCAPPGTFGRNCMTTTQACIMGTIILYLCFVIFTGVMIGRRSKKSSEGIVYISLVLFLSL